MYGEVGLRICGFEMYRPLVDVSYFIDSQSCRLLKAFNNSTVKLFPRIGKFRSYYAFPMHYSMKP